MRNLSQAMATGATPDEREEIENEELDVEPEPAAPEIEPDDDKADTKAVPPVTNKGKITSATQ